MNRDSDSWAKRVTATWFYRIHNKIADPQIPENVGDFRLMDRAVVDALNELPESRRFMKGLFAWVGFRTTFVSYTRPERVAGTTKFNGWRLWNFALEGVTSFSTDPLKIWTYIGGFVASISIIYAAYLTLRVFFLGIDVPGYASVMVAVTFLGGLQLVGIGVIGEYLGRTYLESKRRPIYLIRHILRIQGLKNGSQRDRHSRCQYRVSLVLPIEGQGDDTPSRRYTAINHPGRWRGFRLFLPTSARPVFSKRGVVRGY